METLEQNELMFKNRLKNSTTSRAIILVSSYIQMRANYVGFCEYMYRVIFFGWDFLNIENNILKLMDCYYLII